MRRRRVPKSRRWEAMQRRDVRVERLHWDEHLQRRGQLHHPDGSVLRAQFLQQQWSVRHDVHYGQPVHDGLLLQPRQPNVRRQEDSRPSLHRNNGVQVGCLRRWRLLRNDLQPSLSVLQRLAR